VVRVALRGEPLVLDTVSLVLALARERERGRSTPMLAAIFHESLARAIGAACLRLSDEYEVNRVALSGGVFQNALLLARVEALLEDHDLLVYANHDVPANDGGISLGQALVAASLVQEVA
jgi:hydrogenase maturation protein HypF